MQVTGNTLRRALPFCVAAIALIAGLLVAKPYAVGVFHDDGAYAILAKSLGEGRGFVFLQLPGEPMAIHYPPAYPMVLSVLWWLAPEFPANLPVLLGLNAVCLAVAAYGVHQFCARTLGWSQGAAAAASMLATLSYPLLMLSGLLLSEPMFVASMFLLLPVAERALGEARPRWWFLVLGLACGGLALIRTHGVALPAAVVLLLLTGWRWRDAAWCVGGLVIALLPWQAWQALYGGTLPEALQGSYGSYLRWFVESLSADSVPRTVGTNLVELGSLLMGRIGYSGTTTASFAGVGFLLVGMVFGAARLYRRAPATVWFTGIYLAIVIVWPYSPWRFLFAIWPLLVVFIVEAAREPFLRRARERIRWGVGFVVGLIIVGILVSETRAIRERAWWTPARVAAQQTVPSLRWILGNTTERDVIASEVPEVVYLYTGRKAVPVMPFTASEYGVMRSVELDRANVARMIRELPVNYVVTISPPVRDAVLGIVPPPALLDTTPMYAAFRVTR